MRESERKERVREAEEEARQAEAQRILKEADDEKLKLLREEVSFFLYEHLYLTKPPPPPRVVLIGR